MKPKSFLICFMILLSVLGASIAKAQEKPRIGVLRFTSIVENRWINSDGTEVAKEIVINEFNNGDHAKSFEIVKDKMKNVQLIDSKSGEFKGAAGADEEILDLLSEHNLEFLFSGSINSYSYTKEEISVNISLVVYKNDGTIFLLEQDISESGKSLHKKQEDNYIDLLQPLIEKFVGGFVGKVE